MKKITKNFRTWIVALVVVMIVSGVISTGKPDPVLAAVNVTVSGSSTAFPVSMSVTPGQHVSGGTITFTNTSSSATDNTAQAVINDFNSHSGTVRNTSGLLIGYQSFPFLTGDAEDTTNCNVGEYEDDLIENSQGTMYRDSGYLTQSQVQQRSHGGDHYSSACLYNLDLSDKLTAAPTTDQAGVFGGSTIPADDSLAKNPHSSDPNCDADGTACSPAEQTGTFVSDYEYTLGGDDTPPAGYVQCGSTHSGVDSSDWCPPGTDGDTYTGGGYWQDPSCIGQDGQGNSCPAYYFGDVYEPGNNWPYTDMSNISANYLAAYLPGQSVSFTLPAFTAPTQAGTYTETFALNGNPSFGSYTFVLNVNSGAPVTITSDRTTGWQVSGCSACTTQSSTSGTYTLPPNIPYVLSDYYLNDPHDSGFAIDNNGTAMNNASSLLARLISVANASNCYNNNLTCYLSAGGAIKWNLHSQYCSLTIKTQVNGADTPLSGLSYTVSGGPNSSQTFTSTPQTFQMLSNPLAPGSNFQVAHTTDATSWNGYSLDYSQSTPTKISASCPANGSASLIVNYLTRAKLNVQ